MLVNTCLSVLQPENLPKAVITGKDQIDIKGKSGKKVPWDILVGLHWKYSVLHSDRSIISNELKINFQKIPSENAN